MKSIDEFRDCTTKAKKKGGKHNMHISTHTRDSMERDICNYLRVSADELSSLLIKAGNVASCEQHFSSIEFDRIITEFIDARIPTESLDQVLFFHLTRRLNESHDDTSGRNLADLLTSSNAVSKFLAAHDVKFVRDCLYLFYKNEFISLESRHERDALYLRCRLGYDKGYEDYCFNGFLFKDMLYKNSYARDLFDGPEFIRGLSAFLRRPDIAMDYSRNSTYYCFEYCVPIQKVIFAGNDMMTHDEKQRLILNRVLYRLFEYIDSGPQNINDQGNPILRLLEDDKMNSSHFVSKEIITRDMLIW
ncbi:MAG: hypothetical protein VB115_14445 [Christensenellaceae bacterium]|nr:hypothetical protein [Christensenellaceae bacterium]